MVAGAAAFICARLRGDRRYRPRFGEQYLLPLIMNRRKMTARACDEAAN
jgi:hypothetical protein